MPSPPNEEYVHPPPDYLEHKKKCGLSYLAQDARLILALFRKAHSLGGVIDTVVLQQKFRNNRRMYDVISIMGGLNLIRRMYGSEIKQYNRSYYLNTKRQGRGEYYAGGLYQWMGYDWVNQFMNGEIGIEEELRSYNTMLPKLENEHGVIVFPRVRIENVLDSEIEQSVVKELTQLPTPSHQPCQCHDCVFGSHSIPLSQPQSPLLSFSSDFLHHDQEQYETQAERYEYPSPSSLATTEEATDHQVSDPGLEGYPCYCHKDILICPTHAPYPKRRRVVLSRREV